MVERRGRLLACDFVLATDCAEVARGLAGLAFPDTPDLGGRRSHAIEVRRVDETYRYREDGLDRGVLGSVEAAVRHVRERVQTLALAALDSYGKLHAGCATWNGQSFLVAGPGRAGKSTLMARLLYEGVEVQGDDTVLLRDGLAMAFPRRFGFRRGTLALVPQLSDRAPAWEFGSPADGHHVLALHPGELGFPWRIGAVPVHAIFYLEPAHGKPSRLAVCPRYLMASRLMGQSASPAGGARPWIREIAALVAGAGCFILAIGELDSAIRHIRNALDTVPRAHDPAGAA